MRPSGVIGLCVLALTAMLGLAWVIQGNDFFMYRYFAPKYADVERQVFENTAPYNQGKMQELRRMQEEYIMADPEHKKGLGGIILHEFAAYDENRLTPDLRAFYGQVKRDKGLN